MKSAPPVTDLLDALERIETEAGKIASASETAEAILKSIEKELIGRQFLAGFLGNLRGYYQITAVTLSYDGRVCAHGLKVLPGDKLGSQCRDLGEIDARRLGL